MQGWTPPQLLLGTGVAAAAAPQKDFKLITTIKSYSTKRKALEEKSLGWLLAWWLQAAPSSACNSPTLLGMAGVAFLAASVALGETGDGWVSGCEEKAVVRVMAQLMHRSLPATAPGYQGYQHFPAWLLFLLAMSPWVCWISQLGSPGSEECVWFTCWTFWPRKNLISAWEDLRVYVLTAQIFFYSFFHFSYLRKLDLISLLHSFSRCV